MPWKALGLSLRKENPIGWDARRDCLLGVLMGGEGLLSEMTTIERLDPSPNTAPQLPA